MNELERKSRETQALCIGLEKADGNVNRCFLSATLQVNVEI